CAAALTAAGDRFETSLPSFIDQVPTAPNSICYLQQAVAMMNGLKFRSGLEERLQPGKQRILAVQHIVQRGDRDGVCPVVAQEAAERVELRGRTVQGQHA